MNALSLSFLVASLSLVHVFGVVAGSSYLGQECWSDPGLMVLLREAHASDKSVGAIRKEEL